MQPAAPLIVVTDGWLANAGDAAILLAMQDSLRRAIPGVRIVFCAHHRQLVGDRYPSLDLASPLDAVTGARWPWTSQADLDGREAAERLVENADLVIVPGGGFLFEHYHPEARLDAYEMLLERGARLAFYAQSIGEFQDDGLRGRLAEILSAASLVLARDRASFETIRALCDPSTLHLTADEAFLFPIRRRSRLRRHRALLATVSAHPWSMGSAGVLALGREEIASVAESLCRVLRNRQFGRITLASTAQGLGGKRWAIEDDAIVAVAVRDSMPPELARRVSIAPGYLSAYEYAALAARHSAVVSMRMHGAILATAVGTPALLANGSDKAQGLEDVIPVLRSPSDLGRLDEGLDGLVHKRGDCNPRESGALAAVCRRAAQNARHVAALLCPLILEFCL
jgi:polysaccharide pyruvyl transferase WcaK-like protein